MGYSLGVDLGTTFVAAAIANESPSRDVHPRRPHGGDPGRGVPRRGRHPRLRGRRRPARGEQPGPDRPGVQAPARRPDPGDARRHAPYAVTTCSAPCCTTSSTGSPRPRAAKPRQRRADPPGQLGPVPPRAVRGGAAGRRADRDADGHRAGGGGGALRGVPAPRRRRDHRGVRPGRRHLRRHRAAQDTPAASRSSAPRRASSGSAASTSTRRSCPTSTTPPAARCPSWT